MRRVVGYVVALVVSVAAIAVGIRVAADHTTALERFKSDTAARGETTTTADMGPAPPPGQVFVKGAVDKLTAEGAQPGVLAAPFTLTALERGVSKVTIENALVQGNRTSIAWDGGTPLPVTGAGGSIDLAGSKVQVDLTGATWTVDGARPLRPGPYRVGAAVAVGVGGLATPRDSVSFTADARTVVGAQAGVVIKVAPAPLELTGPGKLTAIGQLQVRDQTGQTPAAGFQFGAGSYRVSLNPVAGRLELDAVLQGPLTRS